MATFDELVKTYQNKDEIYLEAANRENIKHYLNSKSSSTWGQGTIFNTGWFVLATFSPSKIGNKTRIIVCKQEYVDNIKT